MSEARSILGPHLKDMKTLEKEALDIDRLSAHVVPAGILVNRLFFGGCRAGGDATMVGPQWGSTLQVLIALRRCRLRRDWCPFTFFVRNWRKRAMIQGLVVNT